MATLKDVAQKACVDVSTVSRALNNTSYVHPETKARIVAAAKELGYRPNVMAKALRQGRRHTLGVIVPRLHLTLFSEILPGIEHEAERLGYSTLISTTDDDPQREKSCLERMQNSFVDGIIITGTGRNNRLLRSIQASGIAVTQIVRCQEPRISSIVADYEACGRNAVDYLYSKGCRRIALIAGYSHQSPFKGRYEGYSKAIAAHGLEELLAESTQPVNSFEYGYECANQLLRDEPELDAILAVVIGGGSLMGGRFNLLLSVVGALIIQGMNTGILLSGFPPEMNQVVKAVVVLCVLIVQSQRFISLIKGVRSRDKT